MIIGRLCRGAVSAAVLWLMAGAAGAQTLVTTYHDDNFRTGWNQTETALTPASVATPAFGLLLQVHLDEQVDAQPLYVPNQSIAKGTHNVVYVATENDTIYAIDAITGKVLKKQSYGTPVPITALPEKCDNNATRVGFNSTPVYDPTTNFIYAISYTYENAVQVFRLHEINASTLQDVIPSVVISASATLTDGSTANFNASVERQRAALLLSNGNIYAGFASWCDAYKNWPTRGWVLGWNAGSLTPLANNALINQNATSRLTFFLSDVWMSGDGLATDANGAIYFATGNSDRAGNSYSPTTNLEESVVEMAPGLTQVNDFFTPTGTNGQLALDKHDYDFGSGGVLVLPPQPGLVPSLAVAAGKTGPMYLLNTSQLGELQTPNNVLGTYLNDGCWCAQSYFVGSDGIGRVVESSGVVVRVWQVVTSATAAPTLSLESTSPTLLPLSGQDGGFFTTISSNGQTPNTAVVWAVSRPAEGTKAVYLQAFDPANGSANIYSAVAGTWARAGSSNANIVPVVADGRVFVASYTNLSIFGLSAATASHVGYQAPPAPAPVIYADAPHQLHGTIVAVHGLHLTLKTRAGKLVQVDASAAEAPPLDVGQAVVALGDYDAHRTLVAKYLHRQKKMAALWDDDI